MRIYDGRRDGIFRCEQGGWKGDAGSQHHLSDILVQSLSLMCIAD